MGADIKFHHSQSQGISFERIDPAGFSKALESYLASLSDSVESRTGQLLDTLKEEDSAMVSRIFALESIPASRIESYHLHEGDGVLAAMTRRILAAEIARIKGMNFIVDSEEFRNAIDSAGLAARVQNFGFYMRETWRITHDTLTSLIEQQIDTARIRRVVFPGAMGGSAIGVAVVRMLLANIGFESNLELFPHYPTHTHSLKPDDLTVLYSYSGNTEEALLWLESIEAAGAQVIGLSTGGRLARICAEKHLPFIEIPGKTFGLVQPREHLPVAIVLLLDLLASTGLARRDKKGTPERFTYDEWFPRLETTMQKLIDFAMLDYNIDLPFEENVAKQAALFLNWGTTDPEAIHNLLNIRDPVFWASSFYEPIVRRMENQFGECVEHPASAKIMPEDLHNEQEAYVEQWLEGLWQISKVTGTTAPNYGNVFLRFRGPLDGRLDIRADKVFNEFLDGTPRMTFTIQDYGAENPMLGELEALLFCDLTRAYASIFRGVTPHFVHSMTYNKHYMATLEGSPGSTGEY